MKRIMTAVAATLMTIGLVASCGSSSEPSPEPTAKAAAPAPSKPLNPVELTEATFDVVWGASTVEEREGLCLGVTIFPREEVIAMLSSDVDASTPIDWDVLYDLIREECGA